MLKKVKHILFYSIPRTGIMPSDPESLKLNKLFLNYMALLMSMGGVLWGSISFYFGLYVAAAIPLSYTFLTFCNLAFFQLTKNFKIVRIFQVLISLLLPFIFQIALGGLEKSGGVMLWAFLSLVGSMTFQNIRTTIRWAVLYVLLIITVCSFDSYFLTLGTDVSHEIQVLFFAINILVITSVVFGLMAFFINSRNIANLQLENLNNDLEDKVNKRTKEIHDTLLKLNATNTELETVVSNLQSQKSIIEIKNKSITDSLNYASKIQSAILANSDNACTDLDEYFLLLKPRDIVSGDFYKFFCLKNENKFIAAIIDCTGHGVPGAFMSLIGDSLLNQIVIEKQVYDPAEILFLLDEGIHKSLKQGENHSRDGMDLALVCIDKNSGVIHFAGAKNPVVLVQNGNVNYIKGSPFTIGGRQVDDNKKFRRHCFKIEQNQMLYMFSDGFFDQLGGENKRRYLSTNFKDFLGKIAEFPVDLQKQKLEEEHIRWRGENPQTDDILIFGLRLH